MHVCTRRLPSREDTRQVLDDAISIDVARLTEEHDAALCLSRQAFQESAQGLRQRVNALFPIATPFVLCLRCSQELHARPQIVGSPRHQRLPSDAHSGLGVMNHPSAPRRHCPSRATSPNWCAAPDPPRDYRYDLL
jgi:hypothetical protein